jgi:hypothetical protein
LTEAPLPPMKKGQTTTGEEEKVCLLFFSFQKELSERNQKPSLVKQVEMYDQEEQHQLLLIQARDQRVREDWGKGKKRKRERISYSPNSFSSLDGPLDSRKKDATTKRSNFFSPQVPPKSVKSPRNVENKDRDTNNEIGEGSPRVEPEERGCASEIVDERRKRGLTDELTGFMNSLGLAPTTNKSKIVNEPEKLETVLSSSQKVRKKKRKREKERNDVCFSMLVQF